MFVRMCELAFPNLGRNNNSTAIDIEQTSANGTWAEKRWRKSESNEFREADMHKADRMQSHLNSRNICYDHYQNAR